MNAVREAIREALTGIHIGPKVSVREWARENRRIGKGASPLSMHGSIPYREDVMPWCLEPMDAAVDPTVSILAMCWGAGMGKTDGVVTNVLGWAVCESPRNMMILAPIEASRDKYSRNVFQRTINATPALRVRFKEEVSRNASNTIAFKEFFGGSVDLTSAGSVSNFRGPRAGLVYAFEVDALPESVGNEGDPIDLLHKRCEGFHDAIKIEEGTPTITKPEGEKGGSRIWRRLQQSDFRKWFVPCPHCKKEMVILWRHVKWPKDQPLKAQVECENCGKKWTDEQRMDAVRKGQWKPTKKPDVGFEGLRGYWINGLNTTLPASKYPNKIAQLASEWVQACHSENPKEARKVFINTTLAEPVEEQAQSEPRTAWEPLYNRREPYILTGKPIILPKDCLLLTFGGDVQANRTEWLVEGWGEDEQNWAIEHIELPGEPQHESMWETALALLMAKRYEHPSGAQMELTIGLVDIGKWRDWPLKMVRAAAQEWPGHLYGVQGASVSGSPLVSNLRTDPRGGSFYFAGTDAAKDVIYGRLSLSPDNGKFPPGYRHYPQTFTAEKFQQLTAEVAYSKWDRGKQVRKYQKLRDSEANEMLDLSVYSLAAFRSRRWEWGLLRQVLDENASNRHKPQAEEYEEETESFVDVSGW